MEAQSAGKAKQRSGFIQRYELKQRTPHGLFDGQGHRGAGPLLEEAENKSAAPSIPEAVPVKQRLIGRGVTGCCFAGADGDDAVVQELAHGLAQDR